MQSHLLQFRMHGQRADKFAILQTLEPQKCEGWVWKSREELQEMAERPIGVQELFLPVENLVLSGSLWSRGG